VGHVLSQGMQSSEERSYALRGRSREVKESLSSNSSGRSLSTNTAHHGQGSGDECCDACAGSFCSTRSGRCHDSLAHSWYKDCRSQDQAKNHGQGGGGRCCDACAGSFCSTRSGRCHNSFSQPWYKDCRGPRSESPAPLSIVDTAVSNGNFKVLVEALQKAGLVDALSGSGPFTVFAPTDAAFAALLEQLQVTKESLLERADLAEILKYHVISSKVLSSDLAATQEVTTLAGNPFTVTKEGTVVKAGPATVTGADIECSNGVIHVIDAVLLPRTV